MTIEERLLALVKEGELLLPQVPHEEARQNIIYALSKLRQAYGSMRRKSPDT